MTISKFRFFTAIMLVALWFFFAACSEDSDDPVSPGPEPQDTLDVDFLMGFWNCAEGNEDSYPITTLSFGEEMNGMIGTMQALDYMVWEATDSTLMINTINGIRDYNYEYANDSLSLWVGLGGKLNFGKVTDADTVYIEQNPYRAAVLLPELMELHLGLYDATGLQLVSLFTGLVQSGQQLIYYDYPETVLNQVVAFDAIRNGGTHSRQYKVVAHRPAVPEEAKDIVADFWDAQLYLDKEFALAGKDTFGDAWEGTEEDWFALTIQEKLPYLPGNIRRNLPAEGTDSYYWYIADYTYQFGFGWTDGVDDVVNTVEWDGTSEKLTEYRVLLGLEEEEME